jgi:hypothetical protein
MPMTQMQVNRNQLPLSNIDRIMDVYHVISHKFGFMIEVRIEGARTLKFGWK